MKMLFMICAAPRHKKIWFYGGCICTLPCPVLISPGSEDQLGACELPGELSLFLGSLISSQRSRGSGRVGWSATLPPPVSCLQDTGWGMIAKTLLSLSQCGWKKTHSKVK